MGFICILLGNLGAILCKYLKNSLPAIKNWTCVVHLHEYYDVATQWAGCFLKNNYATYFYSFGVEHIPKEINWLWNIRANVFRVQTSNSVIGRYFCIGFIYFIHDNKVFIILKNIYKKYQGNVSRFFSSSFDI